MGDISEASRQRYAGTYLGSDNKRRTIDHLIRGRQDYELMLAHGYDGRGRRSGLFRYTLEPTRAGLSFFVWPLPRGQRVPKPFPSRAAVEREIDRLYANNVPPAQQLPEKKYTKKELAAWLPPDWVFLTGRPPAEEMPAAAPAPRKRARRSSSRSHRGDKKKIKVIMHGKRR